MTLGHSIVHAEGATPDRSILFLHGILGRGLNWRSVALKLVRARPRWAAVLVDLREHGDSLGLAPPHDLDRAAQDVVDLAQTITPTPRAVLGHSFGGKVALALAEKMDLDRLIVVDSLPGARPDRRGSDETVRVVSMLESLPRHLASREEFIELVKAHGFPDALARWLAMSVHHEEEGVRFGPDLSVVRALLDDYFARDLWRVIDPPPDETIVDLIIGGRSPVFDEGDRARAAAIAKAHPDRVHVHLLERAGHWVHVDDPNGLQAVLEAAIEG
jgi:esterase